MTDNGKFALPEKPSALPPAVLQLPEISLTQPELENNPLPESLVMNVNVMLSQSVGMVRLMLGGTPPLQALPTSKSVFLLGKSVHENLEKTKEKPEALLENLIGGGCFRGTLEKLDGTGQLNIAAIEAQHFLWEMRERMQQAAVDANVRMQLFQQAVIRLDAATDDKINQWSQSAKEAVLKCLSPKGQ